MLLNLTHWAFNTQYSVAYGLAPELISTKSLHNRNNSNNDNNMCCCLSPQHISSRRHRDGMAGKPNPLLSRHKKHRGADLTVTFKFHCWILIPPVTQSANLSSTDISNLDEVCKASECLDRVDLIPTKACQLFSFWLCPPPENINSIELRHVNAVLRSKSVSPPCVDLLELIFFIPLSSLSLLCLFVHPLCV